MSWDADLSNVCSTCGHEECYERWNYTHNCNAMISAIVEEMGYTLERHWLIGHMGKSWFEILNGLTGAAGSAFLASILSSLYADPERFTSMNPRNGWGSYETLLPVLQDMHDVGMEYPTAVWKVTG